MNMFYTTSVREIYGREMILPRGYTAEFRIPKEGERFMARYPENQVNNGFAAIVTCPYTNHTGGPRLVLIKD